MKTRNLNTQHNIFELKTLPRLQLKADKNVQLENDIVTKITSFHILKQIVCYNRCF